MALLPLVASPYALLLMLPFIGYSIALLGFNLLFGSTGLLSFGHALFLGVGAYTAAALTSKFGILSFELLLITAALVSGLISLVVGALCVRYTRIFFGMLTLAFGMLFHSFLFKFYSITGGDQGMRVLRPLLLGMEWRGGKTAFLTGPFYYYALVLFALLGLAMWRITQSPFGLHLRAIRENAGKAAYVGVQIFRMRLAAFVISAVYGGIGGTILAVTTGSGRSRTGVLDPFRQSGVHGRAWRQRNLRRARDRRAGVRGAAGFRDVDHAILALCDGRRAGAAGGVHAAGPVGHDRGARSTGAREGDEMQPARRSRYRAAVRDHQRLEELRRVQGAERCLLPRQRRRVRLDRRTERGRQDHAGQCRDRPAAADGRRGSLPGPRYRRHRAGRTGTARHVARVSAGQHLSGADRARNAGGGGGVAPAPRRQSVSLAAAR